MKKQSNHHLRSSKLRKELSGKNHQKSLRTRDDQLQSLESRQLPSDSHPPFQQAVQANPGKPFSYLFTGKELLNMNVTHLPSLVEPIMPKTGVIGIAGSSDTGKSSFLRQLAMAIVGKEPDFLGFRINAQYNRVIYISTEDDRVSMAYLLKKQMANQQQRVDFHDIGFIFDTEKIISKLQGVFAKGGRVDCIIVDAITDLYGGDMNQSNKIRSFINDFSNLAEKYQCLIIFLHHTGKRTENAMPSKDNILGSQGFEAKMRMVIELRRDYDDPNIRHLCIVKGNYLSEDFKQQSFVLEFGDDLRFTNLNRRVPFTLLMKKDANAIENAEAKSRAIELRIEGKSIRQIRNKLLEDGYELSISTVGSWLRGISAGQVGYVPANDESQDHAELNT